MIGTYGLGIAQLFNECQTVRRLRMPVGHDKIDRPLTQNDQRRLDVFGLCESAHPQTFTQIFDDRAHELVVVENKNAECLKFRSAELLTPDTLFRQPYSDCVQKDRADIRRYPRPDRP
jgi:hypothetical protein